MLQFVLEGTQFLLATATLPEHTYDLLSTTFREMTFIVGPGLHCTAPGVTEQLIDCSGGDVISEETGQKRKAEALMYLIQSLQQPSQRTVIFCNKIETCRKVMHQIFEQQSLTVFQVENYLKRKDRAESEFLVLAYHSAIAEPVRKTNLKRFLQKRDERHVILVATDRASRGADQQTHTVSNLFDL